MRWHRWALKRSGLALRVAPRPMTLMSEWTQARQEKDQTKRKQMYGDMQTIVYQKGSINIPALINLINAQQPRDRVRWYPVGTFNELSVRRIRLARCGLNGR
jgi:hypothetical protein